MKYIVKRASMWSNDPTPPVEEAKQIAILCEEGKEKAWVVDIRTIKALMDFQYKYGDIIIRESICHKGYYEILIYDDYIE